MSGINNCYICSATDFSERPGSVRDDDRLKIYECNNCGLVFLSSFEHINDSYYESSSMHDHTTQDIQNWLNITKGDNERRFDFLKPLLINNTLLDFGCGPGGFLRLASEIAMVNHGLELEKKLKPHFKKQNLTVFQNLPELFQELPSEGYGIITLFQVLEHLPDPKKTLNELYEVLADDGQIIIEIPNANDALLSLYNSTPFSNFTYWSSHLFLYTSGTLEMLIKQTKLKVNYIKQIQRYSLSNHLYWLSNGLPGGHEVWSFLNSEDLHLSYEKQLASIGMCDTIVASISKH
jgi:2-polyprenyl-3-methyl-5-hydroxy-6-metoxy-1,4-benzoquinol methylase